MKFKPLRTNIYSAGLSQQLLKVLSNKSVLCPAPLHRTRPGQEECVRLLTSPAATEYIKQIWALPCEHLIQQKVFGDFCLTKQGHFDLSPWTRRTCDGHFHWIPRNWQGHLPPLHLHKTKLRDAIWEAGHVRAESVNWWMFSTLRLGYNPLNYTTLFYWRHHVGPAEACSMNEMETRALAGLKTKAHSLEAEPMYCYGEDRSGVRQRETTQRKSNMANVSHQADSRSTDHCELISQSTQPICSLHPTRWMLRFRTMRLLPITPTALSDEPIWPVNCANCLATHMHFTFFQRTN